MATQSQSMLDLYQSLSDQQDAIRTQLQNCTDPKLATTLATESSEILHRIILTQNLILQQDSAALKKSVAAVTKGGADLQTALNNIQKAVEVVNAVSGYLALVDKAIDLAKSLAAAA